MIESEISHIRTLALSGRSHVGTISVDSEVIWGMSVYTGFLDGGMSMYVSESWIINLLVLYFLHSISILICDFWHRSRADVDLIPTYMHHPTFGNMILALFFGPLSLFVQFAGEIRRNRREALSSAWEVYYTVAGYGYCLYDPKLTYFIAVSAVHFIVRRIARYTRK